MLDVRTLTVGAVDDHPIMLRGLASALRAGSPPIEMRWSAGTVAGLLAALAGTSGPSAGVVLLDLYLRDGSSPADNVTMLRNAGHSVIVYTQESNPQRIAPAVRAGAAAVVGKHEEIAVLSEAISALSRGEEWHDAFTASVIDAAADWVVLSEREREAVRWYAGGLPLKSVARRMEVSEGTAKEYLRRARDKYQAAHRPAGSRTELFLRAFEDGIIPATPE